MLSCVDVAGALGVDDTYKTVPSNIAAKLVSKFTSCLLVPARIKTRTGFLIRNLVCACFKTSDTEVDLGKTKTFFLPSVNESLVYMASTSSTRTLPDTSTASSFERPVIVDAVAGVPGSHDLDAGGG